MRVNRGEIVRMKLYDVADEIALDRLSPAMLEGRLPVRQALMRVEIRSIDLVRPPVVVALGERSWALRGGRFRVELSAHFYEMGVLSIVARFQADDRPLADWIGFALSLDGDPEVESRLDEEMEGLLATVGEALVIPHPYGDFVEDFAFYVIRETDEPMSRSSLLERPELVAMLHGESRPLSSQQTEIAHENSFSFYERDLVVLNYDNALIVDEADPVDLLVLLEYAVAQVLEARYYDSALNEKLNDLYRQMDERAGIWAILFSGRWTEITKRAMKLIIEARLATDGLTSSVRVTEDVFYAQVYNRALKIFRTSQWLSNVEDKLQSMKDACDLMDNEIHAQRSHLLEWIVILLIFIEVIPLLLHLNLF